MNPDADTKCPVCEEPIPLKDANEHVDSCLKSQGGREARETGGKKLTTPEPKRTQSFLNFTSPGTPSGPTPVKKRRIDTVGSASSNAVKIATLPVPPTRPDPSPTSPPSPAHTLPSPLADLVRPTAIEEFVGQDEVFGKNSFLRAVLQTGDVPSMIFWGPPGCGKTTLARIIASSAHTNAGSKFIQLSATTSGVADVKQAVKVATNHKSLLKKKTLLFIDEIHRFNKIQQDSFLPHVENGTITLLGATTENPSFRLNSALLSRCRVIVLSKLHSLDLENLLIRALSRLNADVLLPTDDRALLDVSKVWVEKAALRTVADLSDGDARIALNGLQLSIQSKRAQVDETAKKSSEKQSGGESSGDLHVGSKRMDLYKPLRILQQKIDTVIAEPSETEMVRPLKSEQVDTISNKSSRTAKTKKADKQMKILEQQIDTNTTEAPRTNNNSTVEKDTTTASKLAIVTLEDVKNCLQKSHLLYDRVGDEHYHCISALHKSMRGSDANAALYWLTRMLCGGEDPLYIARRIVCFASEDIGLADPSALTQAVAAYNSCQYVGLPGCEVNLAQAVVYMARAPKSMEIYTAFSKAKASVMEHKGPLPSVPLHLRSASTPLMRNLGYGKGYSYYDPEQKQTYLPEELKTLDFFDQ